MTQNKVFSTNKTLRIRGGIFDLSEPCVMGVLNVTPDSFYKGSRFESEIDALNQVEKMLKEGASFIDVGGYSSRPGAGEVSVEEEQERVIKVLRAIHKAFPEALVSIDTFRSQVAHAAVQEGACMINDISGGEADPAMFTTVANLKVPYILMHMRGTPKTMTKLTAYTNLIKEVAYYLHHKIYQLHQSGVNDVIIDPGFGFAKTIAQNFEMLNHLEYFRILEKPLLAGLSRKSMVWKTLGTSPDEALNGTTALHAVALLKGASMLRVHDVKEAMEVIRLVKHLNS